MMMDVTRMMTGRVGLLLLSVFVVTSLVIGKGQTETEPTVLLKDCTQIKNAFPNVKSGVYTIRPSQASFKVYCEMREDGGWTVFQRRSGGEVSFNRDWKAYKDGFGACKNDHWLGLSKIWALTKAKGKNSTLRVDLWDFEGGSAFAQYQNFRIGSEKTNYNLQVGEYSGNAGDAIRGAYDGIDQNGYGFSTHDRDNDGCSPCIFGDIAMIDCSARGGGGWWFSRCGSADLNGKWHPGTKNRFWASGLYWLTWRAPELYSARATRMMVKSM
ncbi:fibrinogen-like protein 1 isoform X2 [Salminus brasiliensis]|uniref:fibrinogen-like protein 1 isoform X2 n=1 Tax=Salminus brasiliensis TaxID=930266 RepID=UPI003B82FAF9